MSNKPKSITRNGLAVARGFAAGPVFIYRGGGTIPIAEYIVEPNLTEAELTRLKRAFNDVKRDIANLIAALRLRSSGADAEIFEAHAMLMDDPVLAGEIERAINVDRLNAEAAVHRVFADSREKFERMNDAYLKERARDIEDVERRLLIALTGFVANDKPQISVPSIVVADDLTPSEAVKLPREMILGFAMNAGSATSHVALLSRALAIPAVAGLVDITERVRAGEKILLDGTNGVVVIDPDDEACEDFNRLITDQKQFVRKIKSGDRVGQFKDGGEVLICANAHPGLPLEAMREVGPRGIGLYRSEYLWLNRELEPTEEEQFEAYKEAAEFANGLCENGSITIRMLDIGGDKLVRGISSVEANPFLGNRSIRYLLSHRDVMHVQLRAILRASAFGNVSLMYPMISCVEELNECAVELSRAKASLEREGKPYSRDLKVGAMIEVPSAALNADVFARYVDFFSIGTNDLVQYTMAADRGNEAVAALYQPMNRSVLRLVKMTIAAAREHKIKVCICGESAADPVVGVYWAALGVDMLSMSSDYIPIISALLARLTRAELDEYVKIPDSLAVGASASEIVTACHKWMIDKIPDFNTVFL